MSSSIPPRVVGLATGTGAIGAGLVMALLGAALGTEFVGLVGAGLVIAAMGFLIAAVGAIGFALHGPADPRRARTRQD